MIQQDYKFFQTTSIFEELILVNWYHWNESNKKNYLTALITSFKIFKIKVSDNISLNYKLGLEVM